MLPPHRLLKAQSADCSEKISTSHRLLLADCASSLGDAICVICPCTASKDIGSCSVTGAALICNSFGLQVRVAPGCYRYVIAHRLVFRTTICQRTKGVLRIRIRHAQSLKKLFGLDFSRCARVGAICRQGTVVASKKSFILQFIYFCPTSAKSHDSGSNLGPEMSRRKL